MTAHPAPDLLTIAPENLWVRVEGRCIGPITAPPGSPDFAAEFRQLAAQLTGHPGPSLRALDVGTLNDLEMDLTHAMHLAELGIDQMADCSTAEGRVVLDSLLWLLRDRLEILRWKTAQMYAADCARKREAKGGKAK